MATYNKFHAFVEHLAEGVHNFQTGQLVVALTNTTPSASGDAVLTDLPTQATYTFCSSRNITTATSAQTGGIYKLTLTDLTLTASGGSVGPFQFVTIFNDTPTSPADPLICFFDYGSSITLLDTETFLINFDDSAGLFQIT